MGAHTGNKSADMRFLKISGTNNNAESRWHKNRMAVSTRGVTKCRLVRQCASSRGSNAPLKIVRPGKTGPNNPKEDLRLLLRLLNLLNLQISQVWRTRKQTVERSAIEPGWDGLLLAA
ncbi:hypothetical protein RJZ57_006885 [Blastomyces gilchristii]